jgi:hypothetical protein
MAAPWKFVPGRMVCEGGATCEFCSGDIPANLSVTISDVVHDPEYDLCTDPQCAAINDTYILTGPTIVLDQCRWLYTFTPGTCVPSEIWISLYYQGGHYYLQMHVMYTTGPFCGVIFSPVDLGTSRPDCSAWSSIAMPFFGQDIIGCGGPYNLCSFRSCTALVSAA